MISELQHQAIEMKVAGFKWVDMATQLGVSQQTLNNWFSNPIIKQEIDKHRNINTESFINSLKDHLKIVEHALMERIKKGDSKAIELYLKVLKIIGSDTQVNVNLAIILKSTDIKDQVVEAYQWLCDKVSSLNPEDLGYVEAKIQAQIPAQCVDVTPDKEKS